MLFKRLLYHLTRSQKIENRPEYSDFDFLLGNPPTCSEKRAETRAKPEVYSQKTENRPEYADFDFLLGNPPTCSEY